MNELLLIALVSGAAGLLQGAVGFGFGLLALAVLSARLPVGEATAILAPANLVVNLVMLAYLRRYFSFDRLRLLLLSSMIGVPAGIFFLVIADAYWLRLALVIILFTAVGQHLIPSSGDKPWPNWSALPCGLLSGMLTGAFGTGGPPAVAYVHRQGFDRRRYAVSLQAAFGLGSLLRLPGLVAGGVLDFSHLLPGMTAVLCALAGATAGVLVLHRLSNRIVARASVALLAIMGVRHMLLLLRELSL